MDNYKAFVVAQELPIRAEIEASTKIVVPAESDGVVETNDDDIQLKWQTSMRLRLLNHYIHYLKVAVQEGDIAVNMVNPDSMNRIIDSFLLGTSSERLQGKEF